MNILTPRIATIKRIFAFLAIIIATTAISLDLSQRHYKVASSSQNTADYTMDSSFRIFSSLGTGSGGLVRTFDGQDKFITNQHVVGNVGNSVQCEFDTEGKRWSTKGSVNRVIKDDGFDIAIIDIRKENLQRNIKPIKFTDKQLAVGDTIYTCGAERGNACSLLRATVTDVSMPGLIAFDPPAIPGRSGSLLVVKSKDGTPLCCGLVAWRYKDENGNWRGLAMNSSVVQDWLNNSVMIRKVQLPPSARPINKVSENRVVLLTTPGCPPCEKLKAELSSLKVEYSAFNNIRKGFGATNPGRYPQLLIVDKNNFAVFVGLAGQAPSKPKLLEIFDKYNISYELEKARVLPAKKKMTEAPKGFRYNQIFVWTCSLLFALWVAHQIR